MHCHRRYDVMCKGSIRTNYAQRIAQANGRRMLNALISDADNRLRIYRQKLHAYRDTVQYKHND